jgi:hypothetical protein
MGYGTNMHIIKYDRNKVIIGFERAYIDPMATRDTVAKSMVGSDQEKDLVECRERCAKTSSPGDARMVFEAQIRYNQEFEKRVRANPIYLIRLDKSENEIIVTDEEFERLYALTKEHQSVTIGGEVIEHDGS